MNNTTRPDFVSKSIMLLTLCMGLALLSGCATTHSPSSVSAARATAEVPQELLAVSRAVKRKFIYKNDQRPTWPPRKSIDGMVFGNCQTFSRLVAGQLRNQGYQPRFRNVLAPVFPREHVVTVVTDHNGKDWVFDNRRPRPFPIAELSKHYDFEKGLSNRYVGAMKTKWVSSKTRKTAAAPAS